MEFTKDIYFDNSLKAGKESKITYSGYLFQNGSNNVNIVYGFGEAWNGTTTKPMEKAENGFVANVRMRDFDTFNFCFSNENNNWDNNNGFNYISPIIPEVQDVDISDIDFGKDYSTSIDDIIDDILGNTTKQDIVAEKNNNSIDKILESINEVALPEIEALFNDLFFETYKEDEKSTSIPEASIDPSLAEELKEVGDVFDNIVATPVVEASTQKAEEDIKEANEIIEKETIENKNTSANENAELIKLFNELFEISDKPINFEVADEAPIQEEVVKEAVAVEKEPTLNVAAFNLDGLVSDLLEPVIKSETYTQKAQSEEETSLFEDVKAHEDDERTSLAIINSGEFSVSSRRLGYFYKLRKRIRLAFLKLAKTSKDLVKQLGL